MIKYLGSKRTLLPTILPAFQAFPGTRTVVDLFSGSARVVHACKAAGLRVIANDVNAYAAVLGRAYAEADRDELAEDARKLVAELNAAPPRPGFVTATYCEEARYFHPRNGARIDAVREAIAAKSLPPELEAVCLVSLLEAADRVDSTTGVQMAYLKTWAPRAARELELRVPDLLPRSPFGKGRATCADALDVAAAAEGDLVYLDPPYNRHSYLGNYHVWETIVRWDRPAVYGVARKREDVRTRRSAFNSSPIAADAWRALLSAVRAPVIAASCNDEGFLPAATIAALLAEARGGAYEVGVLARSHFRYIGSRIGVYNRDGRKVGRPGRRRNTEYLLFAVRKDDAPRLAALRATTTPAAEFFAPRPPATKRAPRAASAPTPLSDPALRAADASFGFEAG